MFTVQRPPSQFGKAPQIGYVRYNGMSSVQYIATYLPELEARNNKPARAAPVAAPPPPQLSLFLPPTQLSRGVVRPRLRLLHLLCWVSDLSVFGIAAHSKDRPLRSCALLSHSSACQFPRPSAGRRSVHGIVCDGERGAPSRRGQQIGQNQGSTRCCAHPAGEPVCSFSSSGGNAKISSPPI